MAKFVVTIDGPAGSGKSTIAKLLAKREGFIHINSGALYRAVAYILGDSLDKDSLSGVDLKIEYRAGNFRILHNGIDITESLKTEALGKKASNVAKLGFVRDFVNMKVRAIPKSGKFVIDGRDCGSVIFPDADLKIFLTASPEERAKRRAEEIKGDFEHVLEEIKNRDEQDMKREIAPLKKPEGAYEIDTTGLGIEEVFRIVVDLVRRVYGNRDS